MKITEGEEISQNITTAKRQK